MRKWMQTAATAEKEFAGATKMIIHEMVGFIYDDKQKNTNAAVAENGYNSSTVCVLYHIHIFPFLCAHVNKIPQNTGHKNTLWRAMRMRKQKYMQQL